jgi:hypothetical protein
MLISDAIQNCDDCYKTGTHYFNGCSYSRLAATQWQLHFGKQNRTFIEKKLNWLKRQQYGEILGGLGIDEFEVGKQGGLAAVVPRSRKRGETFRQAQARKTSLPLTAQVIELRRQLRPAYQIAQATGLSPATVSPHSATRSSQSLATSPYRSAGRAL